MKSSQMVCKDIFVYDVTHILEPDKYDFFFNRPYIDVVHQTIVEQVLHSLLCGL